MNDLHELNAGAGAQLVMFSILNLNKAIFVTGQIQTVI